MNIQDFKFSYDLNKCDFKLDALQEEMLKFYLREDIRFRRAFNKDYTPFFIQFLKDKSALKEPFHLSIMGTVRGGKSYSALWIAILSNFLYQREMSIKYICGNSFEFLETIKDMNNEETANSCFLIDEEKSVFGVGSLAKKTKLTDVQNIIAKQNISTLSLCPAKFSNQDAMYGLKVFGRDFNQKINRFMLYNLQSSKVIGEPVGLVYLPIFTILPQEYSKPLENLYIEKKDNWINKEVTGEGDILYSIKRKSAEIFAKDNIFLKLKKKDEKIVYIAQKLGSEWAKGEITEIYNLTGLIIQGAI